MGDGKYMREGEGKRWTKTKFVRCELYARVDSIFKNVDEKREEGKESWGHTTKKQ